MAKNIIAILNNPKLAEELRRKALAEIRPVTWDAAATKCKSLYRELVEI